MKKYTCFICGSDQIWNPKFLDNAYYLDFVENAKRLAYAPSMGVTSLTNAEKNYIIPRIKKFDAVSVRETQSADLLKKNGFEGTACFELTPQGSTEDVLKAIAELRKQVD